MKRWIKRIVLGLLALIVVAIVTTVIFIHTDLGRRVIRDQVVDQLADTFTGKVSIGRITGSPFTKLTAYDVVIDDADGNSAISIPQIEIELGLTGLVRKRAVIERLVVSDPAVVVRREPDGTISLANLLKPTPKSTWHVIIEQLEVHRGKVTVTGIGTGATHVEQLEVTGSVDRTIDTIAIDARVAGWWRERSLPLSATASVRSAGEQWSVPVLFADVDGAYIRAGGISIEGDAFGGHALIDASSKALAKLGIAEAPDLSLALSAVPEGARSRLVLAGTIDRETVRGNLAIDISGRALAGSIETTGLSVGRLAKLRDLPDLAVAGSIEVDVRATGDGASGGITVPRLAISGLAQPELRDLVVDGSSTFTLATTDARLPIGTAELHAHAAARGVPATTAMVSVRSNGRSVAGSINASNTAATASLRGEVEVGDTISITDGHLAIAASNLAQATGGAAPVGGSLTAQLNATGQISPAPNLAVSGSIDGRRLRAADASIGSLRAAIDARQLPDKPTGRFDLLASQIDRGAVHLRELSLTAANRADGKIEAALRSRPKQAPWLVEADALIAPGRQTTIDVTRHLIRTADNVTWTGRTGRLAIDPTKVVLSDFKSSSSVGSVAADASYQRRTGDLTAKLAATGISLAEIEPAIKGTVDASVDVARTGGRFKGEVVVHGRGLAPAPKAPAQVAAANPAPHPTTGTGKLVTVEPRAARADPYRPVQASGSNPKGVGSRVDSPKPSKQESSTATSSGSVIASDANLRVTLDGSQVTIVADATTIAGRANANVVLDGPRDITDAAAWKRLGRAAIRDGRIDLSGIDIAKAASAIGAPQAELAAYRGTVDGSLHVERGTASGKLHVRKLVTPELRGMGAATIDLDVVQAGDTIVPTVVARLDTIGSLTAKAELQTPARMFDPSAWHRDALRRVTLSARDLAIDPGRLDMVRLYWTGRGRASFDVEVLPGSASASIALRDLRGTPVAKPVDIDVHATIDRTLTVTVTGTQGRTPLIDGTITIPASLDQLIGNPQALRAAPITGTLTSNAPAEIMLNLFGRTEVVGGTIAGNVRVGGTIAAPQVAASITGTDWKVPPGPGNKPIQTVKSIVINGSWRDRTALLSIDATEDRGTLRASLVASLDAPNDAQLTLAAKDFDLMPVVAFAPGPAGAAAGRLDADIKIRGIDPRTAQITGELHLREGRIPIAPAVGTMRKATIDAKVTGRQVALGFEGVLGDGKVKGTGSVALDGTSGKLTLALRKVSPIGVVEPVIDADVAIDLRRAPDHWVADITVDHATVVVPSSRKTALDPPGAPPDMVFESGRRITQRPLDHSEPARPAIVAHIVIRPTRVESEELRGMLRGNLTVSADGDAVSVNGSIEADRGDLDLFGRRYRVDRASVRFDGSLDPILDVAITHEFAEVSTSTQIRGRVSRPKLIMQSDPGTYSQGQLLGFLLGGEPSGDPGDSRDRATAAGTSYLANRIGGYVRGVLPIDLDVLRYEQASSMSSAAITVGTWVRHELFLAYRRRLDARPDENAGEGELEYWLARRIVIESVVGDRNRDSVDLLWRKRY